MFAFFTIREPWFYRYFSGIKWNGLIKLVGGEIFLFKENSSSLFSMPLRFKRTFITNTHLILPQNKKLGQEESKVC